jgi:hypothetical protein
VLPVPDVGILVMRGGYMRVDGDEGARARGGGLVGMCRVSARLACTDGGNGVEKQTTAPTHHSN